MPWSSSTALESSGEVWTPWTMVWVRIWWWSVVGGGGLGRRCGPRGVRVVVRIVAVRWVRSVLGVVAVCGLSQRVVRAEDVVVEPVWSWNHVVMDVGAVVGMVRFVRSACFSTAAGTIAFVLEATDGGA